MELLHTVDANLIEWFQNVECSKEESARTTSGIEDGDVLQGIVEVFHKQMVLRVRKIVGYELANIKIISNEVVNSSNLTIDNFLLDALAALQAFYGFAPNLGRQSKGFGRTLVPVGGVVSSPMEMLSGSGWPAPFFMAS